ncbi:MAG: Tol-Pal system beta propeller repeat protein TolB [Cardiobacteriaceae bacterium]|nr:Tol-Pal system beta propeller repeat protein TolB [Cardiobacteriaceae bacterium]
MKHNNKWKWLGLSMLLSFTTAQAQVEVNVSGAQVAARPIAILPVQGDPGVKMDYIIASDLHKTGLFQPLAPNSFPALPASVAEINYAAWKQAGADYVVMGQMSGANAGQFTLNDVTSSSQLANDTLNDADARQLAHQAADWILFRLTGKRGVFGTKLAYVLEQGGANGSRRYTLLVSDVDGANRHEIYSSAEPILSPAWAPNGRAIAFVTYANNHAQIVIQDIGGGRRVVAQGDGISSAPAFSPDGGSLAFVQSDNNNPDIYLLNLASGAKSRLTDHAAIDTEPTFSPDGNYIYFTSDRSGSPQIYRMGRNGGGAERVVSGSGYSANSDLSPEGNALVLTRQSGGGYQIGTYDLASKRFDALTNGRLDEGASFAPNGQLIIYATKEGGRSVLKVINSKGGVAQTLSDSSGRLRDPAWGPDTRP